MGHKPHALVLDDEPGILKQTVAYLQEEFEIEGVSTLEEAKVWLSRDKATEPYSVVITDMRLPGDDEGGLTLTRWLRGRESSPEVIILTAYPTFENASKCMQAGAFSYIEKGTENTFDLLEADCIKASEQWYRRQQRIFPPPTDGPVALLWGDILCETEEREADRLVHELRNVAYRAVVDHGGYVAKWMAQSFVAVFPAVDKALHTAFAIRRTLGGQENTKAVPLLQFRASVHWGVVQDTMTLTSLKALTRAHAGQVVLTQQACEALGQTEAFQIETFPPEAQRLPDPQRPTGLEGTIFLYTVQEPLPAWVRFALKAAQDIARAELNLPADLAAHHDDYAQGKQVL